MANIIKGVLVAHGPLGWVYQYTCSRCNKNFHERQTPEVSAPALCHRCFTGEDNSCRRISRVVGKKAKRRYPN